MAELADALDSGSSGVTPVKVQVLLSAPTVRSQGQGVAQLSWGFAAQSMPHHAPMQSTCVAKMSCPFVPQWRAPMHASTAALFGAVLTQFATTLHSASF